MPRPVSFTFEREEEGDNYCARLEALLDRGIVPPELLHEKPDLATIGDALRDYLVNVSVAESDKPVLATLMGKVGGVELRTVNYSWAEAWVRGLKQEEALLHKSKICQEITIFL
ncbi:hypothetical protein QR66_08870 [Chromobacterium piscinae]|nr:hypothetical protein QR66_08870 [Chromobacterium piscinae]